MLGAFWVIMVTGGYCGQLSPESHKMKMSEIMALH